jgi:uncharacterized protein
MELPLFPLSTVLLPRGRLPLQIFEPRYLDLVRDCMKSDSEFGVVWIRRGSEVVRRGRAAPSLGDYGTTARIVDWDQLPNGLLGLTIEGRDRFDLLETDVRANGLVVGQVELLERAAPVAMVKAWQPLLDVLHSLETHPHIQGMGLKVDYDNAWEVGYTLVQVLPLEESIKYELLGLACAEELMQELDVILNQISGED